jgi:dipeptidyl aminopeptidase/acylaminoacyl peptidase
MQNAIRLLSAWTILCASGRAAEFEDYDIVVCTFRTGNLDLFAVNPVSGAARNLTCHPATDKYPACSFDGTRIAFVSDREGSDALYVMDADGSNVRRLAKEQRGFAGMPSWTADGRWLYFSLFRAGPARMCRIRPDGSDFKVVGEGTDPAVSPDGKWISFRLCDEVYWIDGKAAERAYRERRDDKRPVWIIAADGSNPHVIEPLHYKTTIDGSRAPFLKRRKPQNSGASAQETIP